MALGVAIALAGCMDGYRTTTGGDLSGQVVVSGPLRNAAVSVDQLELTARTTLDVRTHLADTTTDEQGRFTVHVGKFAGLFLVTARGGSFADLATGATIQLDPTVSLESITRVGVFDERDDLLVSPFGHLIAARTRARLPELGNLEAAWNDAAGHLNQHFGNLQDWTSIQLASLNTPATSPTESVRAAFLLAALSYLTQDIAHASGATPQDVHVLTLTQALAIDVADGPFDGQDGNNPAPGSGLQVGICSTVPTCPASTNGCSLGCRSLCDIYAGTPRALLAGEVTSVVGLSTLNHTGLVTGDVLTDARTMAANTDQALFGGACIEGFDRLPPKLAWIAPTPDDMAYVRAGFNVKVAISDDTDPAPTVDISGFPNDLSSGAASATIDSTQLADGTLDLQATGRDMAGNTATIHRSLQVDNTPPALTLDPTGYLVDNDTTWWTAVPSPAMAGTVSDASPVGIAVSTSATAATATVTGSSWTSPVPAMLDQGGADVTVTATDAAGNRTQATKHIRADVTPPTLSFPAAGSHVFDESLEAPTFNADAPVHTHNGAFIDLGAADSCPKVTKFSYLLGAASPPFVTEVDASGAPLRNPLHYVVDASDDGVGILAGSVQYRVGFRTIGTSTTTWLLDWTAATGAPSSTGNPLPPGTNEYDVDLVSDQVAQLATTEGIYQVEFQVTDRLNRTTTADRCVELHLRAPALHFQPPGGSPTDTDPIPVTHPYQLSGLALGTGAPGAGIAARLLNDNATGASILDEDVTNGTASSVYLEVDVTPPTSVTASQAFKLSAIAVAKSVSLSCPDADSGPCEAPTVPPTYASAGPNSNPPVSIPSTTITTLSFPVQVFELDSNTLAPSTPVPCITCGAGSNRWTFTIPPRSVPGGPVRRFKIMTMIGQVSELAPSDKAQFAAPPFSDLQLSAGSFTGSLGASSTGCTAPTEHTVGTTTIFRCTQMTTYTAYRALTNVSLLGATPTFATYSTSPTPTISPAIATTNEEQTSLVWTKAQALLP